MRSYSLTIFFLILIGHFSCSPPKSDLGIVENYLPDIYYLKDGIMIISIYREGVGCWEYFKEDSRLMEVAFTTAHRNPDACNNSKVVEVSCDLDTYKQLLAMVLTAQSASMQVDAYVRGCDADGQAKVTALKIR